MKSILNSRVLVFFYGCLLQERTAGLIRVIPEQKAAAMRTGDQVSLSRRLVDSTSALIITAILA